MQKTRQFVPDLINIWDYIMALFAICCQMSIVIYNLAVYVKHNLHYVPNPVKKS